jgi:hypothetical protein
MNSRRRIGHSPEPLYGHTKLSHLTYAERASMLSAKSEAEIGERAARFLKAELKRADVTYDELAKRLKKYGRHETRDSIASKLKRGSFPATFFLACCGALNLASVQLKDI